MELKERIKQLRKEYGYTQEALAKSLGLSSKSNIANYEKGTNAPSDDIKIKMCSLFNCSLDFLMGKSDIRNPETNTEFEAELLRVGLDMSKYKPPTEEQKKQIEEFARYVLRDNKKDKEN